MAKGPAEIAHGPMFIGFVFNILLYGVMISQVYLYYATYKKLFQQPPAILELTFHRDKTWMKLFVAFLFLLDTLNSAFDFAYLYEALIIHFGEQDDVPFLNTADWIFATDPALTGIIAGLVQLFFAWRVKVVTGSSPLVSVVLIASLAGAAGGLATTIEVIFHPRFTSFQSFKSVVILWLAAECFADILITTILVWHLKHKTGFQKSDDMIDRIIRMTMQTGLITSICASLDLIFFLSDSTGTHLIFNFPLSKLYTNSLMSSLNSRGGWKFGITTTGDTQPESVHHVNVSHKPAGIHVHVESHEMQEINDARDENKDLPRLICAGSSSFAEDLKVSNSFV